MADDTTIHTASELVAGYSAGELSPVEVTRDTLQRIEADNDRLRAYCLVDAESAVAQAKESEARWQQGNPVGLLDGVPSSLTDTFLTAGWPTLCGSTAVDADQDWDTDSPVTARLREHGAVLVGKTATAELEWKTVTDSPLTGITRNPWAPDRTSGGASGGSAVAVATGMSALSVGTDAGGSVRVPASFCGVAGFKPTYGRIPVYPAGPFGTLTHAGPMARCVDDLALLLDVLALRDARDPTALPPLRTSYRDAVRRPVRGLVAAYSANLGYVSVDPQVAGIVEDAVSTLSVDVGLHVELVDPGFADPVDDFDVLWRAGAAQWLDRLPAERTRDLDPGLAEARRRGREYSAGDYLAACAARTELGVRMGEFHESYDVLITPTVPITAFAAGHDVPPDSGLAGWPQWVPFSYPFNLTQQPAATLPVGRTDEGLPVGLQIVGPRHSDDLVLAVCRALEDARPWPTTAPAAA